MYSGTKCNRVGNVRTSPVQGLLLIFIFGYAAVVIFMTTVTAILRATGQIGEDKFQYMLEGPIAGMCFGLVGFSCVVIIGFVAYAIIALINPCMPKYQDRSGSMGVINEASDSMGVINAAYDDIGGGADLNGVFTQDENVVSATIDVHTHPLRCDVLRGSM